MGDTKLIKQWVDSQLKIFKDANKDILTFIANVLYSKGSENAETIRSFFAAGYCYYFALMLKDAFGGEICWHKGFGHIVWMDINNGTVYDIDGVFCDYNDGEIVSVFELGETLEAFKHRGKDSLLKEEIEAEAVLLGISVEELEKLVYESIPENERVFDCFNKGDARRYWRQYKNKETI